MAEHVLKRPERRGRTSLFWMTALLVGGLLWMVYGGRSELHPSLPSVPARSSLREIVGPLCADVASAVEQTDGATFERYAPTLGNAFFHHPSADHLTINNCTSGQMFMTATVERSDAPGTFFDIVGRVGSRVTDASGMAVRDAAAACVTKALRRADEAAEMAVAHAAVECRAFRRDGGGTWVSVQRRD